MSLTQEAAVGGLSWQYTLGVGPDPQPGDDLPYITAAVGDVAASSVTPGTYLIDPNQNDMVFQSTGVTWIRILPWKGTFSQINQLCVEWTCDPVEATGSQTITPGTIYLYRVNTPYQINIGSVYALYLLNTPSGLTATHIGIYDNTGTLRVDSGDISSSINGHTGADTGIGPTGNQFTFPGRDPTSGAAAPFVWVAIFCNAATTAMQLAAKPTNGVIANIQANGNKLRCGTYTVGPPTSLPATITPSSMVNTGITGIPLILLADS